MGASTKGGLVLFVGDPKAGTPTKERDPEAGTPTMEEVTQDGNTNKGGKTHHENLID